MTVCEHLIFDANVDVVRLLAHEGGPVTGYSAEVRVRCRDCEEPFVFIGVPIGSLATEPTSNVDGTEARMPMRPLSAPADFGTHLTGYRVRINDERAAEDLFS